MVQEGEESGDQAQDDGDVSHCETQRVVVKFWKQDLTIANEEAVIEGQLLHEARHVNVVR